MNNFWRLPYDKTTIEKILSNSSLIAPNNFFHKIKPRQGIVLAKWSDNTQLGNALALGLVKSVNITEPSANIQWVEVDITLKPNPSGRQFWTNKPFFKFAKEVSIRYMLDDLFSEHFPDIENIALSNITGVKSLRERTYQETPGYIYVIKSQYGYKIGKTVNIKSRTKLFSVKLPFPIELIHYAWFDNYSKAEKMFHDMFASKRLEGEWFGLDNSEIQEIMKHGKQVPVEGL